MEALRKSEKPSKAALNRAQRFIERIGSLLNGVESTDFALVQKPFLWPVAFPDILHQGDPNAGFHIVLANPPYVRMERIDNDDELFYGEAFPEVAFSRADILVYFYARALQILRPGGWLSFITSNKFMRAGYGEGIREHLPASLRIHRVIDFGDLPLFEANGKDIEAYPAVLVGSQSKDTSEHALKVADLADPVRKELSNASLRADTESVRSVLEDLDGLLRRSEVANFPQVMLKKDGWVLEDPALIRLFEKLMNQGAPLGEFAKGRVYRGIVTGLNEAFVIDQDKRDELIENDPRSVEIIKPWLRGRHIRRWKAHSPGLYVIFMKGTSTPRRRQRQTPRTPPLRRTHPKGLPPQGPRRPHPPGLHRPPTTPRRSPQTLQRTGRRLPMGHPPHSLTRYRQHRHAGPGRPPDTMPLPCTRHPEPAPYLIRGGQRLRVPGRLQDRLPRPRYPALHHSTSVGNQQKWHTLVPERSEVGWRSGELPEDPVVLSPPVHCLSLQLPSPSQYVFSPAP